MLVRTVYAAYPSAVVLWRSVQSFDQDFLHNGQLDWESLKFEESLANNRVRKWQERHNLHRNSALQKAMDKIHADLEKHESELWYSA